MKTLTNYVCGQWQDGTGDPRLLHHAVTGEPIAQCSTAGVDFGAALAYAREKGATLRAMTFPQRAALLKAAGKALSAKQDELYELAYTYGATKRDCFMDVDGGVGTLFAFASMAKALPDLPYQVEGEPARLSKGGTFEGRHVCVPLEGVAVQINAYNFPCWGLLEKLAPALLAGMPTLVKPATPTALLAWRVAQILIEEEVLPEGALQIVCGSAGDLLDHLTCQDVLAFTGSAATGAKLRSHRSVVEQSVRFNMEADSLNAIVLGADVPAESDAFGRFVKEVTNEMTGKAGQKCTAIRRILVPAGREQEVIDAIKARLGKNVVGDPALENVRMGPLVGQAQLADVRAGVAALATEAEIVHGDPNRNDFEGGTADKGAFIEPILLHCKAPHEAEKVHSLEAFGPVSTLMGYSHAADAIALIRKGGGSLVSTVYTEDEGLAREIAFGMAPWNGRVMVMNAAAAEESTGHGVAMPQLVHGGPGRAGGGEELGGLRAVWHYMQRTALQGTPERLNALCAIPGAE